MTALLALVVAVTPLAADFWSHDLGTMQHHLAELALTTRNAEKNPELLLWSDVLRFATCRSLSPLGPEDDPRRQLLRIEAARRTRLGPAAIEAPTLWRELLQEGFFSFTVPTAPDSTLRWPIERESWEGEHLLAEPLPNACGVPSRAGMSELNWIAPRTPELLAALGPAYAPAAHRLAYQRAVLAYRAGKIDQGRASCSFVDSAMLPEELRPWFTLLNVELGLGDVSQYVALLSDPTLESVRPALVLRAATYLATLESPALLMRFTEPDLLEGLGIAGLDSPGARYLAAVRATALERSGIRPASEPAAPAPPPGAKPQAADKAAEKARASAAERARDDAARAALAERIIAHGGAPTDLNTALLEEFALAHLATLPASDALAALARYAPAERHLQRMTRVASFALTLRRFELVDDCAARLAAMGDPRGRVRALALTAESALLQNRTAAFDETARTLLDKKQFPPVVRLDRDLVLQELVTSLATHAASLGSAVWLGRVETLLAGFLEQLPPRQHARVEQASRLLAQAKAKAHSRPAADGSPLVLAFGSAAIHPSHPPPEAPPVSFDFPEPFSLLALPAPDGAEVLAWFPRPEPAVSEVPRAP